MTEIMLTNTATRRKERFEPMNPKRVGVYVCGPTVYDSAHIGNARPMIVFDVLVRLLRHVYGAEHVVYVRNITDVDDKILKRAATTGRTIFDITDETTRLFHADMAALGVAPPDHEPRATAYIREMIALIERLIAGGAAYAADGHVLFAVDAFESYGALSGRALAEMMAGARVEIAGYKRHPMDFVLWKPSPEGEQGWDSPFGFGRPGWHIECSAMSGALLGVDFDIHGGGVDLVFPHHENERAQSLCAHPGSHYARYWMHNGFVQVEGEKMSKSLGNFVTVSALRDAGWPGEVIRFAMLSTQYRQPFDWTERLAAEARAVLEKWRALTDGVAAAAAPPETVVAALADDLNTPKAIAALHALAAAGDAAGLKAGAAALGVLTAELGGWERAPQAEDATAARIDALLAARLAARKAKDFARADAIRDGLAAAGVEVRDGAAGAEWSLSRAFDAGKLPEA